MSCIDREQLDAIRARMEVSDSTLESIAEVCIDRRALLAEVERLNARVVAVASVITDNGCMCDCGCDVGYGHFKDSDCNPCLVCRVSDALLEG